MSVPMDRVRYIPRDFDLAEVQRETQKLQEPPPEETEEQAAARARQLEILAARARVIGERLEGREPPVFHIRVPTGRTAAVYQAELTAAGCDFPGDELFFATVRDAIGGADPVNKDELLSLVDDAEADALTPERQRLYHVLISRLIANAPAVAGMIAARNRWMALAPIYAFRHFVFAWENQTPPYQADGLGLVADAVLDALPPALVREVGWHAKNVTRPSGIQEKN